MKITNAIPEEVKNMELIQPNKAIGKYPVRMATVDVEQETSEGIEKLAEKSGRTVASYRRQLYKDAIKKKLEL